MITWWGHLGCTSFWRGWRACCGGRGAGRLENLRAGVVSAGGGAEVDVWAFAIKVAGHTAMSTARELELAWVFAAHPGEELSRDRLLKVRRGVDYLGPTRTLDQSMVQLRWKVEVDPKRPVVWVTVYGAGYCLAAGVRGKFRIYGPSRRGIGRRA